MKNVYDQSGVSVIVPVYNGIKYIDSCMKSLLAQTLKNIQIILVDDGSTDGSSEFLDLYEDKYCNVETIHSKNRGLGMARNIGMDSSRYEFIGFVDIDDTICPDMFEKMHSFITNTGADCVTCDINVISVDGSQHVVEQPYEQRVYLGEELKEIEKVLLGFSTKNCDGLPSAWSKLYRKTIIDKYNLKFSTRTHGEDWQFLLEYLATGSNIAFLHEALYNYIHHSPTSLVTKYRKDYFDVAIESRLLFEKIYPDFEWNSIEKQIEYKNIPISSMLYYRKYHLEENKLKEYARHMLDICNEKNMYSKIESKLLYRNMYYTVKNKDYEKFFSLLIRNTNFKYYKEILKQTIKGIIK